MGNWTDELLDLMVMKMGERKERERTAMGGKPSETVSAETLAAKSRGMVEVKRGS